MKKILAGIAVLFVGIVVISCGTVSAQEAYVTIDINPSVAFVVSSKEKIVSINPLNEDGETVLMDLDLEGLDLENAIDTYIAKAIELGFITEEEASTEVQVEVVAKLEQLRDRIRTRIQEKTQLAFQNRGLDVTISQKVFSEDFIDEAEAEECTPGEYFLIKEAMRINEDLTIDEAKEMTHSELVKNVREYAHAWANQIKEMRSGTRTERNAVLEEYIPQIVLIRTDIAEAILADEDTTILETQLAELLSDMHEEIQAITAAYREEHIPNSFGFGVETN